MEYQVSVTKINIEAANLFLAVTGEVPYQDELSRVRLILHFDNGMEDRRIPFVITEYQKNPEKGTLDFKGEYTYLLQYLFWKSANSDCEITMHFHLLYGDYYEENIPVNLSNAVFSQDGKYYEGSIYENELHIKPLSDRKTNAYDRMQQRKIQGNPLWKKIRPENIRKFLNRRYIGKFFESCKAKGEFADNRITFISQRFADLSDNFQFVYQRIKDDPKLDIQVYSNPKDIVDMSRKEMEEFAGLCATSKVIVLNEFTPNIYLFHLDARTKVVQLWHACGAFKTFGFSRLGKPMASLQDSRHHRNYDYVTVSSAEICKWYAEGFGVPTSHVVPTGIPRTDIFFDQAYKERTREKILQNYPQLKGKKVVLFAPTFRGDIRENAYYPMEQFRVDSFMDAVGEDYFLIIKHHPFVPEPHPIPAAYQDRVLDLTEAIDVNDLLFVSDVVITDYSSLVFEASLLRIPMLFYVFDLEEYIRDRDFYYSFSSFVPGPFVYTQQQLQDAVIAGDYDMDRIDAFARKFFDDLDGQSTQRVVDLLYHALQE